MAITAATFQGYERTGTASYRVRATITDSVKGTYETWFEDVTGTTNAELRQSIATKIGALSAADSQKDLLALITVGQALPIVPTAPTAPTAAEIADAKWVSDVQQLVRVKNAQAAGLASAQLTTDLAALVTSVNSGYTTARAQKL